MATHKLLLELEEELDEYILLAIHCSEEAYKVAFMLNKQLLIQLKRNPSDLDFIYPTNQASYPLFYFQNKQKYLEYFLVGNCSKTILKNDNQEKTSLFSNSNSEKTLTNYLLPEYQQVDFFLKISSELETISSKVLVSSINEIPQVISAYVVDLHTIKLKDNLIFN